MYDPPVVQQINRFGDLGDNSQGLILAQFALFLDISIEVASLTILADDVDVVGRLTQIQRPDDILVHDHLMTGNFVVQQHIVDLVGDAVSIDNLYGDCLVVPGIDA